MSVPDLVTQVRVINVSVGRLMGSPVGVTRPERAGPGTSLQQASRRRRVPERAGTVCREDFPRANGALARSRSSVSIAYTRFLPTRSDLLGKPVAGHPQGPISLRVSVRHRAAQTGLAGQTPQTVIAARIEGGSGDRPLQIDSPQCVAGHSAAARVVKTTHPVV